jgi:protocatechuate 3,4-dioxygenase beta subunit
VFDDEPTPAQTEGPYYTPNTPERSSFLEAGVTGTRLYLTGKVLNTRGEPIPKAMLDFWHCDAAGEYDNVGYKLRGHSFANATGDYALETIVPGIYPGRTRHIHVRVQPPGGSVLTTQLYFPNEPQNASDGIYVAECEMKFEDEPSGNGKLGAFNFVLAV